MIAKFLKITGIGSGVIVAAAVLFYTYASYRVEERLSKKYDVIPEALAIPNDSAAVANGNHLVAIKGCRDCHGDDMGGKIIANDMMLGELAGPNLTRGEGGLTVGYPDENWVKAIRHGLDGNNYPLVVMPSVETSKMSERDLQDMIAYLKTLSPVDRTLPESKIGIMLKMMVHIDKIELIPAEKIDHKTPLTKNVNRSSPKELGKYLAAMCSGCHHENFKGGAPMVPGFPPVPDITSTGVTGRWTQEQFNTALRTGIRPDGTLLDPNMPVQMTKHYTGEELTALYTFLKNI